MKHSKSKIFYKFKIKTAYKLSEKILNKMFLLKKKKRATKSMLLMYNKLVGISSDRIF